MILKWKNIRLNLNKNHTETKEKVYIKKKKLGVEKYSKN